MVDKIGKKKIGKVRQTEIAGKVEDAGAVSSVSGVKATQAVGGAGKVGSSRKRRPTRTMSIAEREKLFKLIDEEADKMFGPNGLPESQREVVAGAVKMAIDSGLLEEEEDEAKADLLTGDKPKKK